MELIWRMFDDTLWIYTAIAGALIGAGFLAWFRDTRAGLWGNALFDRSLDYLVNRWGWTWLQEPPDIWRKRYPRITVKIDELERRIEQLEKASTDDGK
jgi:hypothetical protein